MAGPHSIPNVHPRSINHNQVWNPGTLIWEAMTQPSGGSSDATAANQALEIAQLTRIDAIYTVAVAYDVDDNPIYLGKAAQGSSKASAVWQIKKLTFSGANVTDIQYANGSTAFNQIWNDRASFSYS